MSLSNCNTVKTTPDTEGSYFCGRHQDGYFSCSTIIKNIPFYIYICKSHDHGMNSASPFSFHRPLYKHLPSAFFMEKYIKSLLMPSIAMISLDSQHDWTGKALVRQAHSGFGKEEGVTTLRGDLTEQRERWVSALRAPPFLSQQPPPGTRPQSCSVCLPHYEGQRPLNISQNRSSLLWFSVSDILKNVLCIWMFFVCIYSCVPCTCLVPAKVRWRYWIPWNLVGCEPWYVWVLGVWVLCKNKSSP